MKDGRQRLTLPTPEDQQRALYECHNENNHCGEKRLLLALDAKYYWNSMCKDVKNWVCGTGFFRILPVQVLGFVQNNTLMIKCSKQHVND